MKAYVRSKQVLCLLKEYGPLSFRALKSMMEPKISDPRLHEVLWRMKKNNFVSLRHERLFRGAGVFYRLPHEEIARARIAEFIGCNPEDLLQPYFQQRELLHAELCALWTYYFRKSFPSLNVLRDFQIENNSEALTALIYNKDERDFIPDILLIDKRPSEKPIFIAVEVERSHKSIQRLVAKLKKYASGSHIDGLIYICDSDILQHIIQSIYQTRVLKKAHRVGSYAKDFLLLGRNEERPDLVAQKLFNSESESTSLNEWMSKLCTALRKNICTKKYRDQKSPTGVMHRQI